MFLRKVIILGLLVVSAGCAQEQYSGLSAEPESPLKVYIGALTGAVHPMLISSPSKLASADVCKLDSQSNCLTTAKSAVSLTKELDNGRFIYEITSPFLIGKTDSIRINANSTTGESYARTLVFGKSTNNGSSITWKAVLLSGDYQDDGVAVKAWDNGRKKIAELIQEKGVSSNNITHLSKDPQYTGTGGISVASVENFELSLKDLDLGPNDGCFIHMTSHGSESEFYLEGSKGITPSDFSRILDNTCGDRPTVALVSACYAGIMLTNATKKPNRIILTAASASKTSFGCDASEEYVFYDRCLIESFPTAKTWKDLDAATKACVTKLESGQSGTSDPQSFFGSQVADMEIFGGVTSLNNPPSNTSNDSTTNYSGLSAEKNIALKGKNGDTTLAKAAGGKRYVFVDFSSSTCGYCVQLAELLADNQDALGSKCASVTIVDKGTLGAWVNVAGSRSAGHSYESTDANIIATGSKFQLDASGTPTIAVLDLEDDASVVKTQVGAFNSASGLKNFLSICK